MDDLERLFAYDDWANRQALRSLGGAASRRMAHIVGAQRIWLQRIRGGPPAEVWPDAPVREADLDDVRSRWREVLAKEPRDRRVAYANTKGQRFESTVGEILLHVALHGAYHRGQVASDVRAAGGTPAFTDFIHATREGLL